MKGLISIQEAVELLKSHDVVAIPTETVYGLAGNIFSDEALKKIFSIKERPFYDPLIVHLGSTDQLQELEIELNKIEIILTDKFWPGPLTIIKSSNQKISPLITAGLETVAIRIPNNLETRELINQVGPVAAPSANLFSKVSPTKPEHVFHDFNKSIPVLSSDTPNCDVGIESTIIQVKENKIIIHRPGVITTDHIKEALFPNRIENVKFEESKAKLPQAPGQIKKHYSPNSQLVIIEEKDQNTPDDLQWIVPSDPCIAARQLYSQMRILDQRAQKQGQKKIFFILKKQLKEKSEWSGLFNRLEKASYTK